MTDNSENPDFKEKTEKEEFKSEVDSENKELVETNGALNLSENGDKPAADKNNNEEETILVGLASKVKINLKTNKVQEAHISLNSKNIEKKVEDAETQEVFKPKHKVKLESCISC